MKRPVLEFPRMLIRPMPLFPLQFVLNRSIASIAKRHPRIFQRLGNYAEKTFLIDPVDMPFVLILRPKPENPILEVKRTWSMPWDARISGTFIHLLRLVEAESDGDALFFSRDLVIEGNTEAVVALRNALDDMDSNVVDEAAKAFGKPGIAGLKLARKMEKKLEELHHAFTG